MTRDRDAILEELAHEEHRLAEAERTSAAARARLETLRSELAARPTPAETAPPAEPPARLSLPLATAVGAPKTSADKVKLFRALFQENGPRAEKELRVLGRLAGRPPSK